MCLKHVMACYSLNMGKYIPATFTFIGSVLTISAVAKQTKTELNCAFSCMFFNFLYFFIFVICMYIKQQEAPYDQKDIHAQYNLYSLFTCITYTTKYVCLYYLLCPADD